MPNITQYKINRNNAMFNLLIGGFIAACALVTLMYSFYQIINITTRYNKRVKQKKELEGSKYGMNNNQLLNKDFDNEEYTQRKLEAYTNEPNAETDDEYARISQSIRNSFSTYDSYNQKMNEYYKLVKNIDSPDTIDASILDAKNDNY